ncbi:hypothetical protein ACFL08_04295 [Patescibacteria group bacterium]
MKQKTKRIIMGMMVFIFTTCFMSIAFAADSKYIYTPTVGIPGSSVEEISTFPGYLKGLYKFAVWSVGIAALLMISIGGFQYFISAGNASKTEKSKSIITDALWGLVAVMLAWLVLNVINPDLIKIDIDAHQIFKNLK